MTATETTTEISFKDKLSKPFEFKGAFESFDISFDTTHVGNSSLETLNIKNKANNLVALYVKRSTDLPQVFYFNKISVQAKKHEQINFKISYKPIIPHEKNFECFHIFDAELTQVYKVCLRGESTGPAVVSSIKTLTFTATTKGNKSLQTFELKNTGDIEASYQIDMNVAEYEFQINVLQGKIKPKKSVYLTASFNPKFQGVVHKTVFVLVLNSEPIKMDLLGICALDNKIYKELDPVNFRRAGKDLFGFEGYMSDGSVVDKQTGEPLYSISDKFLDFGKIHSDYFFRKTSGTIPVKITSITNYTSSEITIRWDKDTGHIFEVNPQGLVIDGNSTGFFECRFTPNIKDSIFSKVLTAQVYWQNRSEVTPLTYSQLNIPVDLKMEVIGTSFMDNRTWLTEIHVHPKVVYVPFCLPGRSSYTTFTLKANGLMSVVYRLCPPKNSYFIVKPPVGKIDDYKILVVQLKTYPCVISRDYSETWYIEGNGKLQRNVQIKFKGKSENATVVIGNSNKIKFSTAQPGCEETIQVPVKNTSCYNLKVALQFELDCFRLNKTEFELRQYEEIMTEWSYTAREDVPENSKCICLVSIILPPPTVLGKPWEHLVDIKTGCSYSQLCATPKEAAFDIINWGSTHSTKFHVFNFGQSTIFFKLFEKQQNNDKCEQKDIVTISVINGYVKPGQNVEINVDVQSISNGDRLIEIFYLDRIAEDSEKCLGNSPTKVFTIRYKTIYATIQVKEIVEHDFGALFHKRRLWYFFNINDFNNALVSLKHNEIQTVDMVVPEFVQNDTEFKIIFKLENTTKFAMEVELTRLKLCDCQQVNVSTGVSLRKKVFQCPHREMIELSMSDNTVIPGSFQYLELKIKYHLIGAQKLGYIMRLSNERTLKLIFNFWTIAPRTPWLSIYNRTFNKKLFDTFIGAIEPPVQFFWLYNNTDLPVVYKFDETEMIRLCNVEGFPVMQCLNTIGSVKPQKSLPLMVLFRPIELKTYKVTCTLSFQDQQIKLEFIGRGVQQYNTKKIQYLAGTMPLQSKGTIRFPATLSTDHVVLDPFSVFNCTERLIFIKNHTNERIFYTWTGCFIEGLVSIEMNNSSGILDVKERHMLKLIVKSLNQPFVGTVSISCLLMNFNQYESHETYKEYFKQKAKTFDSEFTYGGSTKSSKSSNATSYEVAPDPIKPVPFPEVFTQTLAISIQSLSSLELAHFISPQLQFQQYPSQEVEVDPQKLLENVRSEPQKEKVSEETRYLYDNTLQCLLMDVIKSPMFMEQITCQKEHFRPYYVQLRVDEKDVFGQNVEGVPYQEAADNLKKEIMKKSITTPSATELSAALNDIIINSIPQIFHTG